MMRWHEIVIKKGIYLEVSNSELPYIIWTYFYAIYFSFVTNQIAYQK